MPLSRLIHRCLQPVAIWSAAAICMLAWTDTLVAQKGGGGAPQAKASAATPPPAPQQSVTFAALAQAVAQQDYSAVQIRRFTDANGQVVSVREQVKVDADGSNEPPFELSFLGVEGELPGSAVNAKWQQTYARYGALFHKHGSFSVRDLAGIQQNYTLHEFGPVVRAGRAAVRTVVFPQSIDKSIWVVDVDAATMVPLCWAEFDSQLRLLAEVEVVSFSDSIASAAVVPPAAAGTVQHPDFAAARTFLGDPPGVIELPPVLASYAEKSIETRDDPLNGQQKLITTYTDGVDEFLVVQVPGTTDVFANLLPPDKDGNSVSLGHTIARFRDASMRVLLFWEDGVSYQVTGRGSLSRLDGAARQIYLQALSTN